MKMIEENIALILGAGQGTRQKNQGATKLLTQKVTKYNPKQRNGIII